MRSGSAQFKIRRDAVLCFAVRPVFAAEDVSTPRVAASKNSYQELKTRKALKFVCWLAVDGTASSGCFCPPPRPSSTQARPDHLGSDDRPFKSRRHRGVAAATGRVFSHKRGQNMARSFRPGFLALTPRLLWLPPPWLGSHCRPFAISNVQ